MVFNLKYNPQLLEPCMAQEGAEQTSLALYPGTVFICGLTAGWRFVTDFVSFSLSQKLLCVWPFVAKESSAVTNQREEIAVVKTRALCCISSEESHNVSRTILSSS